MKFTLTFNCDNAAFEDNLQEESARILKQIANRVENTSILSGAAFDINGNKIGEWGYEE